MDGSVRPVEIHAVEGNVRRDPSRRIPCVPPGHAEVDGESSPRADKLAASIELQACVLIKFWCDPVPDASSEGRGCKPVRQLDGAKRVEDRVEELNAEGPHRANGLTSPWDVVH